MKSLETEKVSFDGAGDGDFGRQLAGLPAAGPKDVVETVGGGDHVALDQLGDGLFVDDHFVVGDQVVGFRPTRRVEQVGIDGCGNDERTFDGGVASGRFAGPPEAAVVDHHRHGGRVEASGEQYAVRGVGGFGPGRSVVLRA